MENSFRWSFCSILRKFIFFATTAFAESFMGEIRLLGQTYWFADKTISVNPIKEQVVVNEHKVLSSFALSFDRFPAPAPLKLL